MEPVEGFYSLTYKGHPAGKVYITITPLSKWFMICFLSLFCWDLVLSFMVKILEVGYVLILKSVGYIKIFED